MDGFRFEFEDNWEFDSGMDEGGRAEFTSEDGELGRCKIGWKAGSGGDDFVVDEEVDGRGGGELIV